MKYLQNKDTAREFINKRLNELCSEHGISAEEVRLHIFYVCYVTYTA